MRKKIILCLLVLIGIFAITGCGSSKATDNTSDKKVVVTVQGKSFNLDVDIDLGGLHYKENNVDFHIDPLNNMRTMNYTKDGNIVFEVRTMYDENRSIEELKAILSTELNAEEQSKKVNGIEYIYYEYKSDDLMVHHYIHVYNGKVYTIAFFLGEDPGDIEDVFMNELSFK